MCEGMGVNVKQSESTKSSHPTSATEIAFGMALSFARKRTLANDNTPSRRCLLPLRRQLDPCALPHASVLFDQS